MDFGNAILVKEMRTRMRGMRAFVIVETYVLALGVIMGLVYWAVAAETRVLFMSGAGLWLTSVAIFVQTAIICLISPTFTAAAISSEREQETFDLLVASLATPFDILVGKVGASLLYLVLILLLSLPLLGFFYWIGGVSVLDIAICYLVMLASGTAYCTLSFLWSTLLRRAVLAQMVSVASVIVLVVGLPGLSLFVQIIEAISARQGNSDWIARNVTFALLRTNPFYAETTALFSGGPSVPSGVMWSDVPGWVFQVAFCLVLTVGAGYLAWWRLGRVRQWIT